MVAAYRKIHLFDMDNKDTGVRLMESDYVLKGTEIVPPVLTPIGKLALSIVSLKQIFSSDTKHISMLNNDISVMICDFPNYH